MKNEELCLALIVSLVMLIEKELIYFDPELKCVYVCMLV